MAEALTMTSLLVSLLLTLSIITGVVPGIFLLDAAASSRSAADNLHHFIAEETTRLLLDPRDLVSVATLPTDDLLAEIVGRQGLEGYRHQIARVDMTSQGLSLVWYHEGTGSGTLQAGAEPLPPATLADFTHQGLSEMTIGQTALVVRILFDPKNGDFYCGPDTCDVLRMRVL